MHAPCADSDEHGQHDRRHAGPRAQPRGERTAEDDTPAYDRGREHHGIAHDPHRPRSHLAQLGGRLRADLAATDLALPALAEQVGNVLDEDGVDAMAAVEVIAHVDGEDGDVGDGDDRRRDREHPSDHGACTRRPTTQEGRGHDHRDDERDEHAEAGGDEIRAQSCDERESEDGRRRRLPPRRRADQKYPLRLLRDDEQQPPEREPQRQTEAPYSEDIFRSL